MDFLFQITIEALGSVLGTGLVAIWLIIAFNVPSFDLDLNFIPRKMTPQGTSLPVLDISIVNKKWWLSFQANEILFGLFIPENFIENKNFFLVTGNGQKVWNRDWRGANRVEINGEMYVLSRQKVSLPVYRKSVTHFLRVAGNFSNNQNVKIYYYFETQYGKYPLSLKQGKKVEAAQNNKLPFATESISN